MQNRWDPDVPTQRFGESENFNVSLVRPRTNPELSVGRPALRAAVSVGGSRCGEAEGRDRVRVFILQNDLHVLSLARIPADQISFK